MKSVTLVSVKLRANDMVKVPGDPITNASGPLFSLVAFPGCFRYFLCHMGFYATTEVKEKNRYYPVFRSDKSENRLIEVETLAAIPDAQKVKCLFDYDYQGRRVRKTVCSDYSGSEYTTTSTTTYVWDGMTLIAEVSGNTTNLFTYGADLSGSLNGAAGIGGLLWMTLGTSGTYCVAYNGNGDVMALVGASDGSVCASYAYGPFAETLRVDGPVAKINPLRYSTRPCDDETGLYSWPERYYHPDTGRWLGPDPIQEDGGIALNVFVQNDPVNQNDMLGQAIVCKCPKEVKEFVTQYMSSIPDPVLFESGGEKYYRFSRAGGQKGDALKAMILRRMIASKTEFILASSSSEKKNLEDHVNVRADIVNVAKRITIPKGVWCAKSAAAVYINAKLPVTQGAEGIIRYHRYTAGEKLIPGDWTFMINKTAYGNEDKWPDELEGEHLIYLGIPDKLWGGGYGDTSASHGRQILTVEEWKAVIDAWENPDKELGKGAMVSPQDGEREGAWYPTVGLRGGTVAVPINQK